MAYCVLFDPTGFLSDLSGYRLFGDVRFGSNGSVYLPPALALGSSSSDCVGEHVMWDDNLSDGVDTDVMGIQVAADLTAGTAQLSTGGAFTQYSGTTGGTIGEVIIRAATTVPGTITWSSVSVQFGDGNTPGETLFLSSEVIANNMAGQNEAAEQILVITPTNTNYDRVVVSAEFRMQVAPGVCPGPTDIFGQVLIMPGA